MIKLECIGRLVKDPELRYSKDGKEITSFTIASHTTKDETTFVGFTTFGTLAKTISKQSHKGDMILVDGIIKNNNYTDKDGNKHYEYAFIGNRVEFLSRATESNDKPKNKNDELSDDVFAQFGNKIDIEESELAF